MKDGVLKGARELIAHHKKTVNQDFQVSLLQDDANRLEK